MSESTDIEAILQRHSLEPAVWEEPTRFDMTSTADRREVARRFANGTITHAVDRLELIADDLFEVQHPDRTADSDMRQEFVQGVTDQGPTYGEWFAFPWKRTLERYPAQSEHQALRTFRNKNLVTEAEQQKLLNATVGVFGLSVGSSVVEQLTLGGIGGTLALGDYDRLAPSNLNRIRATMAQVGMAKLDIAACKISEADPYIRQLHYHDGATAQSLAELSKVQPDLIFDEIDDLATKALIRQVAREQRIPVVMVTDSGDSSLVDVERYDIDAMVKPFNGRISDREFERVLEGELTPEERQKMMIKIVGIRHITPRLLDSSMEVGHTLGGLPQLGTTATAGGALAAVAARELVLDRRLDSGRYVGSPKRAMNLERQTSFADSLRTVGRFVRRQR